VAVLLLVILSWLILLIVILYVVSAQTGILFRQRRIGLHQKPFVMFKFRSLKSNVSLPLQERRFWLGDILRALSLDEIPQLINVLRGEMSLVGPRPLPVEYLERFSKDEQLRHTVRPGVTGLAQVSGRNEISWGRKFELDRYYVANLSFLMDMRILIKTVILLFSFRKDRSLTEKEFTGNRK
jgi:lipopolysaccharide/colanic/teichoic acid biosynthesis glycosyltransferase